MKCYDIDFNSSEWFTALTVKDGDAYLTFREDLPVVGEEVFVLSLESSCFPKDEDRTVHYSVGFGYLTKVTKVEKSNFAKDECYLVYFENTYVPPQRSRCKGD